MAECSCVADISSGTFLTISGECASARYRFAARNSRLCSVTLARKAGDAPCEHVIYMLLQAVGCRFASASGVPSPVQDEIMIEVRRECEVIASTVAFGVSQLIADLD